MDAATAEIIESVTQKTLHAHNFSRSSSQATHVLSDLLSRYLEVLASTCARYADHAGRTTPSSVDAIAALDELGVSVEELSEYYECEGKEMARYIMNTARRTEELAVLKDTLAEGFRQDQDDAIPLVYAELPSPSSSVKDEEEVEESFNISEEDINESPLSTLPNGKVEEDSRPTTPLLPPSPVSNPSMPSRKRARLVTWDAPDHIPYFFPPYPTTSTSPPSSPAIKTEADQQPLSANAHERAITPPPQISTSASTSDYLAPIPYSMSSLSSIREQHLPERPDVGNSAPLVVPLKRKYELPVVSHSLTVAYHHVLTNPPPTASANPLRHRVAMALLGQMYVNPKWTAADTLFSNLAAPRIRVLAPAPSYPVPLKDGLGTSSSDKSKDVSLPLLPAPTSRPVMVNEAITPLSNQATSRIHDIARAVLPLAVYNRAARITPPVVLSSGPNEKFLYGSGVPAPWNSNSAVSNANGATSGKGKDQLNGKSKAESTPKDEKDSIVDATLFATWEFESHDFRQPLAPHKRGRVVTGNFSSIVTGGPNTAPHRLSVSIRPNVESGPSRKPSKLGKETKGK